MKNRDRFVRHLAATALTFLLALAAVAVAAARPALTVLPPGESPAVDLTASFLSAVAGFILSLVLRYVPSERWAEFKWKREVLAGIGLVVTAAVAGLHYLGAVDVGLGPFGWPVVWHLLQVWFTFAGAGQLAYTVEKRVDGRDRAERDPEDQQVR